MPTKRPAFPHIWGTNGFCIYCHNIHQSDNNARSSNSDGFTCWAQRPFEDPRKLSHDSQGVLLLDKTDHVGTLREAHPETMEALCVRWNSSRKMREALILAQTTIERLQTVHPGGFSSCAGTLDVIREALQP